MKMEGFSLHITEEENNKLQIVTIEQNMDIVMLIWQYIMEFEREHGEIQSDDLK